jgi:hypothetical protein
MADNKIDPTEPTTKMRLSNDLTVNGIKFKAGNSVEVPKRQAADLERMDFEHNEYLKNLNKRRNFEVNAGTIGMGSGAQ